MSRWRVRRMLAANKVKVVSLGKRKVGVLLSELRNAFPSLWDSIQEKKHLDSMED